MWSFKNELCGEVVFLDVVTEGRVVTAAAEECIAADGYATADEDLGQAAIFAFFEAGQMNVGHDGGD